jgi:hypothetical protein
LEIAMTAALTAPDIAPTQVFRDEPAPNLAVILVAPTGTLSQCRAAIDNAVLAGAVALVCEVDVDDAGFASAVSTALRTVDDAAACYPGLPIVLVGHADASAVASLAAEACGEEVAGLVLTHQHASPRPTRRAA